MQIFADKILRQKEIASVADVSTEALGAKTQDVDLKMTSERAVKAGKEMYISKLAGVHSLLPMHIDALYKQHVNILMEAQTTLRENAVGVEDTDVEVLLQQLTSFTCDERKEVSFLPDTNVFDKGNRIADCPLRQILQKNEELAKDAANATISSFYSSVRNDVRQGAFENVEQFDASVAAMKVAVMEESARKGIAIAMRHVLANDQQIDADRETVILKSWYKQLHDMQEDHEKQLRLVKQQLKGEMLQLRKEGQKNGREYYL